jgi:hypothetical protein
MLSITLDSVPSNLFTTENNHVIYRYFSYFKDQGTRLRVFDSKSTKGGFESVSSHLSVEFF